MMTMGKADRSSSPVHVHVQDDVPVHVHVKKSSLSRSRTPTKLSFTEPSKVQSSNLKRSTAMSRSRSRSPGPGPWIPPPGKTTKGNKLSWQGPSHRLEIQPQLEDKSMRLSDLSTDDEDRVHSKMRQYESKIDSLMTEMGTLKNEVDLQRTMREIDHKDELLNTSRKIIECKENELEDVLHELDATERENIILKRSMEALNEISDGRVDTDRATTASEELMKKLVEVEFDGQAAAKQVASLRDTVRRLREERRMSSSDCALITKQKELLMEKLADFETSNRSLRHLLRDQHRQEAGSVRLAEQRDVLLKKLGEADEANQILRIDLMDRDRYVAELKAHGAAQRDENLTLASVQHSLESTRGHLQKQLRQKEADCNRMAVQVRALESSLAQEKIETDHLQELLAAAREKAERDKEALKKATRVQKQRATRSEDAIEQLNAQLLERETNLAEVQTQADQMKSRMDKLQKEKSQALAENGALRNRIMELETRLETNELRSTSQIESLTAELHVKSSDASVYKLENERLKTSITTIEDKLAQAETEVTQLRSSLRQYEHLVDEYRTQMNQSRQEADEAMIRMDDAQKETQRVQQDGDIELERVRNRLQQRLNDLEPLPEMLKTTELRLQDAVEKNHQYERRHAEHTQMLGELSTKDCAQEPSPDPRPPGTMSTEVWSPEDGRLLGEINKKVDLLGGQLDGVREKYSLAQDEKRNMQNRMDSMDRRVRDGDEASRDLLNTIAKKEDVIRQQNLHLEEKTRENASLTRQLENALTDARRQAELSREKTTSKERSASSRIMELESQLSQIRSEMSRTKREKEESERRFNSRLYDLKDRLEQSHSTNRSMQNYVQFLKNSYANVFGDSSVCTSSPMRSSYH
ncbi:outer dense fiber protein 2-like isoform X2 [Lineus longissimus]|uniref:outer dense fiber protein 2-like isoform X2 n=1 Tax=Lineus longissimus TaxID=88925 RepID=UPI00315D38C6